jgi:hypothetical protein
MGTEIWAILVQGECRDKDQGDGRYIIISADGTRMAIVVSNLEKSQ